MKTKNFYVLIYYYPCVVAFAMGNSQDGFNLCEAYLEIKKLGDSRPILAENVRNMWNSDVYLTRDGSHPKYNDRPVLNIESMNKAKAKEVLYSMTTNSYGFEGICLAEDIDKLAGNKPRVVILNKCDLSDRAKLDKWIKYY